MAHLGISVSEIDGAIQDVHLDATGNLAMVRDAKAVGQHAKQRLKTFEGEWFLNSNIGVAWIPQILGSNYDPALSESVIKSVIAQTDGVTEITSFSVKFNKQRRELAASAITVGTIYDSEVTL